MRWVWLLIVAALAGAAAYYFAGSCRPGRAADYFPYRPGMVATYEGKGNEFASYTVRILYHENQKVEWRLDNGGTVMAEVFQIDPNQVTRVYREGESYDADPRLSRPPNASQVVLRGPIKPGTAWTSDGVEHRILSVDETVEAAGQTLTCVVLVEAKHEHSTIRSYYHREYGMVLSVFQSGGDAVESRLAALTGP